MVCDALFPHRFTPDSFVSTLLIYLGIMMHWLQLYALDKHLTDILYAQLQKQNLELTVGLHIFYTLKKRIGLGLERDKSPLMTDCPVIHNLRELYK